MGRGFLKFYLYFWLRLSANDPIMSHTWNVSNEAIEVFVFDGYLWSQISESATTRRVRKFKSQYQNDLFIQVWVSNETNLKKNVTIGVDKSLKKKLITNQFQSVDLQIMERWKKNINQDLEMQRNSKKIKKKQYYNILTNPRYDLK